MMTPCLDGAAAEPLITLLRGEADRQHVPVFQATSISTSTRLGDCRNKSDGWALGGDDATFRKGLMLPLLRGRQMRLVPLLVLLGGCGSSVALREGDWSVVFESEDPGEVNDCLTETEEMFGPVEDIGGKRFTWDLQFSPPIGDPPLECSSEDWEFSCCSQRLDFVRCLDGTTSGERAVGFWTLLIPDCTSAGTFKAEHD
jgi:hypothetical protein